MRRLLRLLVFVVGSAALAGCSPSRLGEASRVLADIDAGAAAERGIPLIMLTASDAPIRVGGGVWRALHTPLLVARTVAAAGLARGGRRAAILRPRNGYGDALSTWFREAWRAGGGEISWERDWDPADPRWAEVARDAARANFDTVFIPCGPVSAALVASHLAAHGVWARGARPRFEREKGVREVIVLGTPEWYAEALVRQAGRYLEGAVIPVPFAAEVPSGGRFARELERTVGRRATFFDAYLADAIDAVLAAHLASLDQGRSPIEALSDVEVRGATAGLSFASPDAAAALYVLEVRDGHFAPSH